MCLKGQRDAGASISVLGKRPSAKSGNLRQKAAKQRGIAGQSNLKAFMKPQAAPKPEQAQLPAINADDLRPASEGLCWPRELPADADSSRTAHLQAPQRNGVPDAAHGSLSQQCLCQESVTVEPALSRQAAGPERERQSIDRVCEREGGQASMQNGVSCRSSGPDDVDELVAAANQWEDVKSEPPSVCPVNCMSGCAVPTCLPVPYSDLSPKPCGPECGVPDETSLHVQPRRVFSRARLGSSGWSEGPQQRQRSRSRTPPRKLPGGRYSSA